ncbi:MAG: hypothetical protein M3O01_14135, partial [Pseudomonadota bacterium]|nr:hypothetical protein [Pseudomonadota bacterium]
MSILRPSAAVRELSAWEGTPSYSSAIGEWSAPRVTPAKAMIRSERVTADMGGSFVVFMIGVRINA